MISRYFASVAWIAVSMTLSSCGGQVSPTGSSTANGGPVGGAGSGGSMVAGGGSGAGATGGSSGTSAGGTSAAGGAGGEGTCPNTTPPPSSSPPTQPGCYVNAGNGWVQVPCLCELWVENTIPSSAKIQIALTMIPATAEPTLAGPLDVEVAFDDADSSWYAVWAKQPGSGSAFVVTTAGGTTTVRLATSSVVLAPVPLSACQTRNAKATVSGNFSATLDMHATLIDGGGNAIATTKGTCMDLPPP